MIYEWLRSHNKSVSIAIVQTHLLQQLIFHCDIDFINMKFATRNSTWVHFCYTETKRLVENDELMTNDKGNENGDDYGNIFFEYVCKLIIEEFPHERFHDIVVEII